MIDFSEFTYYFLKLPAALVPWPTWLILLLINVAVAFLFFRPMYGIGKIKHPSLRNFPGPAPTSLIFGNLLEILEAEHGKVHEKWCKEFGTVFVYTCLFGSKRLSFIDPKAINHVLKRSEDYTRPDEDTKDMKRWLGEGIATAQGDRHRQQRKLLNPFFTPAKLKEIAPAFDAKAQHLREILKGLFQKNAGPGPTCQKSVIVDMYQWYSRVTIDIMGKAAFNHEFDALNTDEAAGGLIPIMRKLFMSSAHQLTGTTFLLRKIMRSFPSSYTWLCTERVQAMAATLRTLHTASREIYNQRRSEMADMNSQGDDIVGLLIKSNIKYSTDPRVAEEEAIAQISTFLGAGTDTSATLLSWLSWELALHPEIQEKLRNEVLVAQRQVGTSLTIPHNILMNLPYLEAVCREMMRLIPPIMSLLRVAKRSDRIPLSAPLRLRDGQLIDHIPVEPGQTILIPISAYQRSEQLFGSSTDDFDPERWLSKRSSLEIPGPLAPVGPWAGLLAFSNGPKGCIGYRFALITIKTVLAVMLQEFKFEQCTEEGLKFERRANSVVKPRIAGKKNGAEMPLRLSVISQETADGM